jgi:hypothetical protein
MFPGWAKAVATKKVITARPSNLIIKLDWFTHLRCKLNNSLPQLDYLWDEWLI